MVKKQSLTKLKREVNKLKSIQDKEVKRQKALRDFKDEKKKLEEQIKRLKQSPFRKKLRSENLARVANKINDSGLTKAFKKRGKIILRNLERLN